MNIQRGSGYPTARLPSDLAPPAAPWPSAPSAAAGCGGQETGQGRKRRFSSPWTRSSSRVPCHPRPKPFAASARPSNASPSCWPQNKLSVLKLSGNLLRLSGRFSSPRSNSQSCGNSSRPPGLVTRPARPVLYQKSLSASPPACWLRSGVSVSWASVSRPSGPWVSAPSSCPDWHQQQKLPRRRNWLGGNAFSESEAPLDLCPRCSYPRLVIS